MHSILQQSKQNKHKIINYLISPAGLFGKFSIGIKTTKKRNDASCARSVLNYLPRVALFLSVALHTAVIKQNGAE